MEKAATFHHPFSPAFRRRKAAKAVRPLTRAAACGPVAASGDHAGLPANRPRRFPHPGHKLLLRPRDIVGDSFPRLKQETYSYCQYPHLFFCWRILQKKATFHTHFLLLFAAEKQQKPLRPVTRGGRLRPGCGVGRPYGFASKPSPTLSAPGPQAASSPS